MFYIKAFLFQIATIDKSASMKIFDYLQGLQSSALMTLISNNSITSLFRLLFTKRNVNERSIKIAEKILNLTQDKLIAMVLNKFLNETDKMDVDVNVKSIDPIKLLENSDLITNKKSNEMLEHSEVLGEKLGKLLLENVDVEKTGLIVDWLTSVELEIANSQSVQLQVSYKHIKLISKAFCKCMHIYPQCIISFDQKVQ